MWAPDSLQKQVFNFNPSLTSKSNVLFLFLSPVTKTSPTFCLLVDWHCVLLKYFCISLYWIKHTEHRRNEGKGEKKTQKTNEQTKKNEQEREPKLQQSALLVDFVKEQKGSFHPKFCFPVIRAMSAVAPC